MSEKQTVPWVAPIVEAEARFIKINRRQLVQWEQEAGFARQAIQSNAKLQRCAPRTIRDSIVNVAAVGLTLNPTQQLAFLVPRKEHKDDEYPSCCLDISYRGLLKLATDTGSVVWAKAELVHEADELRWYGPAKAPHHEFHPFSQRGDIVGVYCIAKLHNGDVLAEAMSSDEIEKIRGLSKSSAWIDFWGEMAKKCVIKRASKTWPRTERTGRLDQAITVLNQHEGLLDEEPHDKGYALKSQIIAAMAEFADTLEIMHQGIGEYMGDNDPAHLSAAIEAWHELSMEEMSRLSVAPTKALNMGINPPPFSIKEKAVMTSEDWNNKAREMGSHATIRGASVERQLAE